jgi:hypothetical protein
MNRRKRYERRNTTEQAEKNRTKKRGEKTYKNKTKWEKDRPLAIPTLLVDWIKGR